MPIRPFFINQKPEKKQTSRKGRTQNQGPKSYFKDTVAALPGKNSSF